MNQRYVSQTLLGMATVFVVCLGVVVVPGWTAAPVSSPSVSVMESDHLDVLSVDNDMAWVIGKATNFLGQLVEASWSLYQGSVQTKIRAMEQAHEDRLARDGVRPSW